MSAAIVEPMAGAKQKKPSTRKTTVSKPGKGKQATANKPPAQPKTIRRKKTRKKPPSHPFRRWLYRLTVLGIWGLFALLLLLVYYAHDLPNPEDLHRYEEAAGIEIYTNNGTYLSQISGNSGFPVSYAMLPDHLIQVVLAIEDRRFFSHPGIDMFGILRAALANLSGGGVAQGGSTITQQLAKISFLSPERTFKRKIQEAMLSLWLEAKLSKENILTLYLNRVYLGGGYTGIGAAARGYFGKKVAQLSLYESAMLAGLLKAPSRLNPKHDAGAANARMRVVLSAMVEAEFALPRVLENTPYLTAKQQHLPHNRTVNATDFMAYVRQTLPFYLGLGEDGLRLSSTLDIGWQHAAEQTLSGVINRNGATHHVSQGAVVVLNEKGAILAMVGSANQEEEGYNRAVTALRQPGSAFKFFVYLAALEAGISPQDRYEDMPLAINGWQPENYGDKDFGTLSVQDAFAFSANRIAVQLAEKIGRERIINLAQNLGITSALRNHPSISLGTSEVSLLELTAAYASLTHQGASVLPYAIRRIETTDGKLLESHASELASPIISDHTVTAMRQLLAAVTAYGTGKQAGNALIGKTGTSQDHRDAWFIGIAPQHGNVTIGVWLGNDDNRPMKGITGGGLPARIARDIVEVSGK